MEKHSSYDEPPNTTFFVGKELKSAVTKTSSAGVSPSKRLIMRTQCIDQLDKWHALLEKGCVTQADYNEMQGKIMADMRNI